jgi:hypothetical protein
MTTKKYLINKLPSELVLKAGYVSIPPGGSHAIHHTEVDEATIVYAVMRDWAEISDTEPKAKAVAKPEVEVEITKPYEGLTEEELKEELAAKAAAAEEKDAEPAEATGTPVEVAPAKTRKAK